MYGQRRLRRSAEGVHAALALRPNDAGAGGAKATCCVARAGSGRPIGLLRKAPALDPRDVRVSRWIWAIPMVDRPLRPGRTAPSGTPWHCDPAQRDCQGLPPPIMIVFRSGDLTRALAEVQGTMPRHEAAIVSYLLTWHRQVRAGTDVAAIHARLARQLCPDGRACGRPRRCMSPL